VSRVVVDRFGSQRADDADLVGDRADLREDFADLLARFAELLERMLRGDAPLFLRIPMAAGVGLAALGVLDGLLRAVFRVRISELIRTMFF
jgi:hypothetical protein